MTTTPAGRPEPEQAMLKALEDIAPAGPWGSSSRSTIEVRESEDWARATINVNASKLIGPKVKRYLLAMAPDNVRALVESTASLRAENERLRDVLHLNGFVRCDIAACNCGSWHARFGLRERFDEIKEDLADAGHPLTNDNGNMPRNALRELISERNAQTLRIAELEAALQGMLEIYGVTEAHLRADTMTSSTEVECCNQARAALASPSLQPEMGKGV